MKKLILSLFALVIAFGMSALAQDNMGSMGQSNSSDKMASSSEMGPLKTLHGWVSDEKCGAKNAGAKGAACAQKCVAGGEKIVFVNDKDKKVYGVKNPDELKDHVGHHVKLSAHVNAESGEIHVMSVSMLGAKKKKAAASSGMGL